jgi:hypothetical protein
LARRRNAAGHLVNAFFSEDGTVEAGVFNRASYDVANFFEDVGYLQRSGVLRAESVWHTFGMAALDWSHELLSAGERTLFARLSVFSGGRTLGAMEAVCDHEGGSEVMEGVEALLEKNLLTREEGIGGKPRFVMLETVHEYAREKLQESGEAEAIKRAHAQYFVALAEEAEPHLLGASEQAEGLERMDDERDNLRAALSWSLGGNEPELGLRLAGAMSEFWYERGSVGEGLAWLEGGARRDSSVARLRAGEGALRGGAADDDDWGRRRGGWGTFGGKHRVIPGAGRRRRPRGRPERAGPVGARHGRTRSGPGDAAGGSVAQGRIRPLDRLLARQPVSRSDG